MSSSIFTQSHHPAKHELRDFLSGEIEGELHDSIDRHIEDCDACKDVLETLCRQSTDHVGSAWLPKDLERIAGEPNIAPIDSRFTIVEEIARGGMGIVYRARDEELDRDVAVKVLARNRLRNARRFEREAVMSAGLQHPGMVPVHQTGQLPDGRAFIVMKLIEGRTLRAMLDEESDDDAHRLKLLRVFHEVCQTMAYAHSRGIIHRDLKPANIMVGSFGEVQVMDWGLTRFVAEESSEPTPADTKTANAGVTRDGTVIGTPAYMPPEQARAEPTDCRTDVFALGGILCEILTDLPPFPGSTATESIAASASAKVERIHELIDTEATDAELAQLAKDCLAPRPNDRPTDASKVSDRLQAYFDSQSSRLREAELDRVRANERLDAETKRRRQVFWLAAAIAGILVATTVASVLYLNERNSRQTTKFASESRIRSIMLNAQGHLQAALSAGEKENATSWRDANVAITRAHDIVTSDTDTELLNDLKKLTTEIESGLRLAEQREDVLRKEAAIAQAINDAIELSAYPNELMVTGYNADVTNALEEAFAKYGLVRGEEFGEPAERIRTSSISETIIAGIRRWQLQHNSKLRGKADRNPTWFKDLLNAVDPNEFRTEVRELTMTRDAKQVVRIVTDDRALSSVFTAHTVFDFLNATRQRKSLERYMNAAQAEFPDDFEVNYILASYNKTLYPTQPQRSIRHLMVCLALQPDNPGLLISMTKNLLTSRDYDGVIRFGTRMMELHPQLPQSYNNVAVAHSNAGRREKALEVLLEGLEVAPTFYKTHINLAATYKALNRDDEALHHVKRGIELSPRVAHSHFLLASIQRKRNDFVAAEATLRSALEIEPSHLSSLQLLIVMLRNGSRFDEAIEVHKQQVKYHRLKTDTWAGYAETLVEAERYEEAEKLIDGPFKRHHQPRYATILARALWLQGKKAEAIETLKLQMRKRFNSPGCPELLAEYEAKVDASTE